MSRSAHAAFIRQQMDAQRAEREQIAVGYAAAQHARLVKFSIFTRMKIDPTDQ